MAAFDLSPFAIPDEPCELCGQGGQTIVGMTWTPWGWVRTVIHAVCENSKTAKRWEARAAGARGMN